MAPVPQAAFASVTMSAGANVRSSDIGGFFDGSESTTAFYQNRPRRTVV